MHVHAINNTKYDLGMFQEEIIISYLYSVNTSAYIFLRNLRRSISYENTWVHEHTYKRPHAF